MTESQIQSAVFKWAAQPKIRHAYPELALLHHIPNGGKRDAIEAKHLRAQGVKAGVPDLCLPVARGGYHGLYIELKTEKGRVSDHQAEWLERLDGQGYRVTLCRGYQEAIDELWTYLTSNDG